MVEESLGYCTLTFGASLPRCDRSKKVDSLHLHLQLHFVVSPLVDLDATSSIASHQVKVQNLLSVSTLQPGDGHVLLRAMCGHGGRRYHFFYFELFDPKFNHMDAAIVVTLLDLIVPWLNPEVQF